MKRFTIVTATYNCGRAILDTARSIREQGRIDIQWIVCDGGSESETLQYLTECSEIISVLISEPDEGIYDAWNKACFHIQGEWVLFLGAGDTLFSKNTINECDIALSNINSGALIVYGKLQLVNTNNSIIKVIGQDWQLMKNKWQHGRMKLPVHPEVFHHQSLFKKFKFKKVYKIVGDSDFLIRAIKITDPIFIDIIVTKMISGGVSQDPKRYKEILNEIALLNQNNRIKPPYFNWLLFKLRLYLKNLLFKVFNEKIYSHLRSILKF